MLRYKKYGEGDNLKTETKAELLRYILLQESRMYDSILFHLLEFEPIRNAVALVDERTFNFKVEPANGMISAKQFLYNMSKFLKIMRNNFFNILPLQVCIIELVKNGKQEINDLLTYTSKDSSDEVLEELVNKLIISTFIHNAKYVPSIQEELAAIDIPIKEVREYNLDESRKVVQFMSDVVFCQRGRGNVLEIFDDIGARLDYFSKSDPFRKRKRDVEAYKQRYIDSRIDDYNKLFKTYHSKKKYLKYFM